MGDFPQSVSESIGTPSDARYYREVYDSTEGRYVTKVGVMKFPTMTQGEMQHIFSESETSVISDRLPLRNISQIVWTNSNPNGHITFYTPDGALLPSATVTGDGTDITIDLFQEAKYFTVEFGKDSTTLSTVSTIDGDVLCYYPDEITTPDLHRRLDTDYESDADGIPDSYSIFVSGANSYRTTTHTNHDEESTESEVP